MKAMITGGTSGVGYGVAQQLSAAGWEVTIVGRNMRRGTRIASEIGAQFVQADLSLMSEVYRLAMETEARLDALVLCAGLLSTQPAQQRTVEGYELTFATNYLGRFVLSQLLLPQILTGGSIVMVGGDGKHRGVLNDWANPQTGMAAARTAALAVDLYAAELARQNSHLRIHTCFPGVVRTNLLRNAPWWMRLYVQLAGTSIEQGSSHITTLVTQHHEGIHWDKDKPVQFRPPLPTDTSGLFAYSQTVLDNYRELV